MYFGTVVFPYDPRNVRDTSAKIDKLSNLLIVVVGQRKKNTKTAYKKACSTSLEFRKHPKCDRL